MGPSCSCHNNVPLEDESEENPNSVNFELSSTANNADLLHRCNSDLPLEHGWQSGDLPLHGNLDISVKSSNPDLTNIIDFFNGEVNDSNSNTDTIQANQQLNIDHLTKETKQLKEDSVPKQNSACTAPKSSKLRQKQLIQVLLTVCCDPLSLQ